MEWISGVKRFYYGNKQLPINASNLIISEYQYIDDTIQIRTDPLHLPGILEPGRLIFVSTKQRNKPSFVSKELPGEWEPLPEPIEGLYLIKDPGPKYHTRLYEFATWPVIVWLIENGEACPYLFDRFAEGRRWDHLLRYQKEYDFKLSTWNIRYLIRAWHLERDVQQNFLYCLDSQPEEVIEALDEDYLRGFLERSLYCAGVRKTQGQRCITLVNDLISLYYNQQDKIEVIRNFLLHPKQTDLFKGDLISQLNIQGPSIGSRTKACR